MVHHSVTTIKGNVGSSRQSPPARVTAIEISEKVDFTVKKWRFTC